MPSFFEPPNWTSQYLLSPSGSRISLYLSQHSLQYPPPHTHVLKCVCVCVSSGKRRIFGERWSPNKVGRAPRLGWGQSLGEGVREEKEGLVVASLGVSHLSGGKGSILQRERWQQWWLLKYRIGVQTINIWKIGSRMFSVVEKSYKCGREDKLWLE